MIVTHVRGAITSVQTFTFTLTFTFILEITMEGE